MEASGVLRSCVTLENIASEEVTVFWQIDYCLTEVSQERAYFHAQFRRSNPVAAGGPFTLLEGVRGRGHYVGGSTVGMIMRDLALAAIKGDPFTIDAKLYAPNEVVYAKDVALAINLACQAKNPKQRTYNAGSGVVAGPEDLARVVKELAPNIDVKVTGSVGGDTAKNAPLDLSVSKAELGYAPKYPLKEALRDYMDELWMETKGPL